MTQQPVRAIYDNGLLRPLDPLDLTNGEEVSLLILSDDDRVRAALGDLLAETPPDATSPVEVDIERLMRQVADGFAGHPSLSEAIMEERLSGL